MKLTNELNKENYKISLNFFLNTLKADIVFLLNEDGIILDHSIPYDLYSLDFSFMKNKNIRSFYNLPIKENLSTLAHNFDRKSEKTAFSTLDNWKSYISFNKYENLNELFDLNSSIPFSKINLIKTHSKEIFGVITFNTAFAYTGLLKNKPFAVFNKDAKLKLYNNIFLDYFNKKSKNLLESKIENIFSPSPIEVIKGKKKEYDFILNEKWDNYISENYSTNSSILKNHGEIFYQIDKAINNNEFDIKIEITFTNKSETAIPNFIINGTKYNSSFYPDNRSYYLGRDSRNAFVIKKAGTILHKNTSDFKFQIGTHKIVAFLRDSKLAFYINGECLVYGKDIGKPPKGDGFIYMVIDNKEMLSIDSIKLCKLPKHIKEFELPEVKLLNSKFSYFNFEQITNFSITNHNGEFHYAFSFNDISHFKKDIKTLKSEKEDSKKEIDYYKSILIGDSKESTFIGKSPLIMEIKQNANIIAASSVTVLIEGATGTGKEVLARYIHNSTPDIKGQFIKVDCATLPPSLLESELFGFEKGAFTGANQTKIGKFEEANNGTLFIDEIGNLSLEVQAKLLQFLNDFTIERIGSNKRTTINTRIIIATNIPLLKLVEDGRFRSDLYYRVNSITIELPKLIERTEDIPLLCDYFLNSFCRKFNKNIASYSSDALNILVNHSWPGNIRELSNVIQNAVLFSLNDTITDKDIKMISKPISNSYQNIKEIQNSCTIDNNIHETTIPLGESRKLTKEHIIYLLKTNKNSATKAAIVAQISRATFFRKIKEFNITRKYSDE